MAQVTLNTDFELYSDKNCLLKVHTPDGNYLHQSWEQDGKVVVYENMPCNYPAGYLSVFDSLEAYFDAIKRVDWINNADSDSLIRNHIEEDEHGVTFPFPLQQYKLYYTEHRMEDDAPTGKFQYDVQGTDIDDAVNFVKDNEAYRIQDDVEDDIELDLNRATITWTHKDGYECYFVLEPVEEDTE